MKHVRPSPGISVLPDGLKMYQGYLEYFTTIEGITPGKVSLMYIYMQGILKGEVSLYH